MTEWFPIRILAIHKEETLASYKYFQCLKLTIVFVWLVHTHTHIVLTFTFDVLTNMYTKANPQRLASQICKYDSVRLISLSFAIIKDHSTYSLLGDHCWKIPHIPLMLSILRLSVQQPRPGATSVASCMAPR